MKVGDRVKLLVDCMGIGFIPKGTEGIITYISISSDTVDVHFGSEYGIAAGLRSHHFECFSQQSARHNSGKTQVREVDPSFILGLGEVLTASREKYDEGNWMKETKFSTPYESAMRHLMKFWAGEEFDEETSKHHLLHAATNLMFLYYHTRSDVGIDDRLFKKGKK